jgi:hypothetical protein
MAVGSLGTEPEDENRSQRHGRFTFNTGSIAAPPKKDMNGARAGGVAGEW